MNPWTLLDRIGAAADPHRRVILILNLIAQIGIVITGALVRLTGSGLGCPTWPQCTQGNIAPVANQPEGHHVYIEFGNRMLTWVLVIFAVASLVVVRRAITAGTLPTSLRLLAATPLLGVVAQALLGGMTVLTGLNPWYVAAHLLLSGVLIALSAVLLVRATKPASQQRPSIEQVWLGRALMLVLAVVLTLGTMVTGSGPHSGDPEAGRMGFDVRTIAWLHADVVWLFCGLVAIAAVVAYRFGPAEARRPAAVLVVLTLLQGAVGYVQYFTGVPVPLVTVHLTAAALLIAWCTFLAERFGAFGIPARHDANEAVTGRE